MCGLQSTKADLGPQERAVKPPGPLHPTLQSLGWERRCGPVWRQGLAEGGVSSPTCLGRQHEGGVAFFVLLVHIQERTAAE